MSKKDRKIEKPNTKHLRSGMKTAFADLTPEESAALQAFFADLKIHCQMTSGEAAKLKADFENAVSYYLAQGMPLAEALSLLDVRHLGGFYARPSVLWFPLDDAAKIYPISLEHGTMAVFRLAAYLREPIVPVLLQMALTFTIKRFPSFATTLKKGFFWHYLDTAKRRFSVEQESEIPCQPLKVSRTGSQTFRVLYYENRISVEFFHVLTDGSGAMTFFKALLGEYLRLSGKTVAPSDAVWDVEETPDPSEYENAFAAIEQSRKNSGFINKPALQMNGRLSRRKPCRILHFKMPSSELVEAAHRYGGSVTAYLLALVFHAIHAATDDVKGEYVVQVPVNMRKFYPTKSVRNFSMYCGVRENPFSLPELPALVPEIDEQLRVRASREAMTEMLTSTEKIVGGLRAIPLVVKQPVAKLIGGFLGDMLYTSTLSNLGVVELPEGMAEEIGSMDFVLSASTVNRASCGVISVNGVTTLSVTKMTVDPSFEEKLYDLIVAEHIDLSVEGSNPYES